MPDEWLTTGQAARLAGGVSQDSVRGWVDDGRLPCTWTLGGQRRIKRTDLEQALSDMARPR